MNYSRFGAIREVDSEQAVAPLCGHAGRVLGRILKVGVQNLKQGVQVYYNGPPFLMSPLAEFATPLANFAQLLYKFDAIRVK